MEIPVGGFVEFVRTTVPLKVFKLVTVTFVSLEDPCRMISRDGFGRRLNPGALTFTVTFTVWLMPLTVAFTRRMYEPAGVVDGTFTVRVEVAVPPAGRLKLLVLSDGFGPVALLFAVMFAIPVNPLKLVSVIVEVAEDP